MRFPALMLATCLSLWLGACAGPRATTHYGPRGFWQPNRFDRKGLEQGRWCTYFDSANKQPFTTGRYRHGRPVRTFKYYGPAGVLDHSERYGREGFCEVTYWYPGGQVARRGPAQWVTGAKGARFYWFGPWVSFTEKGDTTALETYVDGTQSSRMLYENGRRAALETYDRGGRLESTQKLP